MYTMLDGEHCSWNASTCLYVHTHSSMQRATSIADLCYEQFSTTCYVLVMIDTWWLRFHNHLPIITLPASLAEPAGLLNSPDKKHFDHHHLAGNGCIALRTGEESYYALLQSTRIQFVSDG